MHAELYLKIETKIIKIKDMETKFLNESEQPAMQNSLAGDKRIAMRKKLQEFQTALAKAANAYEKYAGDDYYAMDLKKALAELDSQYKAFKTFIQAKK